jgi:hypothetical protein
MLNVNEISTRRVDALKQALEDIANSKGSTAKTLRLMARAAIEYDRYCSAEDLNRALMKLHSR